MLCAGRHNLHQPARAGPADRCRIELGLLADQAQHHRRFRSVARPVVGWHRNHRMGELQIEDAVVARLLGGTDRHFLEAEVGHRLQKRGDMLGVGMKVFIVEGKSPEQAHLAEIGQNFHGMGEFVESNSTL